MHSIKFDIGRGPRSGRTGIVGVLGLHATGEGPCVKFTVALGTLVTVPEILGYDGDLHYDCDLLFGLRRLPRWPILTDLRTQRSPRDYLMERMRGDSNLEEMN
jgi:hypothetical protein